ncbi:MAG: Fe-S cluster assembly protein SufD [Actinobacteria bacterium]|nr:Fe-S cluster assembly protein SufD [Actinomycetota bacterium]
MRARRAAAVAGLGDVAHPDAGEEVWRYSRIDELDLESYLPSSQRPTGASLGASLGDSPGDSLGAGAAATVVLCDGWIQSVQVSEAATEAGVLVGTVADLEGGPEILGAVLEAPVDLFGHLNRAFCPEPLAVLVPDGIRLDGPVVIVSHVATEGVAAFPRLLVRCGIDAEATVVEVQTSDDVGAMVTPVLEAIVGRAGRLRHAVLQELGQRVWQMAHQEVHVGQEASVELFHAGLGGDYARTRTDCRLLGRGAGCHITAAYFGDGSQALDYRTFLDHAAPDTVSELLFKGAVDDASRSVYSGLIRVRPEAVRTRANQTNRNIKLSPDAWAESVPNLEIETDDVMCSHASTVSPVDADQRFYLESRGVPTDVAERLLLEGFFAEVVEAAPVPAVGNRLHSGLRAKLDQHEAVGSDAA